MLGFENALSEINIIRDQNQCQSRSLLNFWRVGRKHPRKLNLPYRFTHHLIVFNNNRFMEFTVIFCQKILFLLFLIFTYLTGNKCDSFQQKFMTNETLSAFTSWTFLACQASFHLSLLKVHIPPLTKFRPETPCGVKRSHAKNFRNRSFSHN